MTEQVPTVPVDPARHRAFVASIYASLPVDMQFDALDLIEHWPRLIHTLARAGELVAPDFHAPSLQAASA